MKTPKCIGWSLKSVTKKFGDTLVLDNIDLEIKIGNFVAICGRSGVGKSTLLRMMSGLTPTSTGEIFWNGELLAGPQDGIGYVTQNYTSSLLPWFTVERNIALPLFGKIRDKKLIREKVSEVLSQVGLFDISQKYPSQLSGGMQQRVALARALVSDPLLLILDEPFASVDALVRLELEDLLISLVKKKEITTLLVTHDVDEAIYLSDRVLVLGGVPAKIVGDIDVELGENRTQISTRSSQTFLECRARILKMLLET